MKTNGKPLLIITFLYIYLPLAAFLCGFTKWWVWVITFAMCGYAVFGMFRDYSADDETREPILINPYMLIGTILVVGLVCVFLGWGGIFSQAGDWPKHNAVLHDLTEKNWPVYYTKYEKSMLTYYLGQYIVPSLIGKISIMMGGKGFSVASSALAIWSIIGVVLVFCNLVEITKSNTLLKQIRCLVIMFFFCGALTIVQMVAYVWYEDGMYSLGENHWLLVEGFNLQYRSNLVMLRWVFPQVIVIWLIITLLLKHIKHVKHYVILIAPILFFGTFSILVSVLIAVVYAIYMLVKAENKKGSLLEIFSLSNIGAFLTLGVVLITYFLGYMQVEKPDALGFHVQDVNMKNIWAIIIFVIFMVGIYAAVVYKMQKKNPVYYCVVISLCVIPFFKMGIYNDWVMGVSIPALWVLMCYAIEYLNEAKDSRTHGFGAGVLTMLLIVGAIFPVDEIKDNVKAFFVYDSTGVFDYYGSLEKFSDRQSDESQDLIYNYFTYDLDGKIFYEVFAREKID